MDTDRARTLVKNIEANDELQKLYTYLINYQFPDELRQTSAGRRYGVDSHKNPVICQKTAREGGSSELLKIISLTDISGKKGKWKGTANQLRETINKSPVASVILRDARIFEMLLAEAAYRDDTAISGPNEKVIYTLKVGASIEDEMFEDPTQYDLI